jgi:PhoPQ-activated pathogenicity-related protein
MTEADAPAAQRIARARPALLGAALAIACLLSPRGGAGELAHYVAAPGASYAVREIDAGAIGSDDYIAAILTSRTWHGVAWKPQLLLVRPGGLAATTEQALLFIDGGSWDPDYDRTTTRALPREASLFFRLAQALRAPVAVVREVPFEPLFGRREDALIAYSFEQYFHTGEADWPLLLPMVKSASRAMDAVQQLARQHWGVSIARFTLAGASKRGWTSWLTAAVDARVASIAPMVIDMLNMSAQIELQRRTFGGLSESIHDYERIHLPDRIDSPAGRELVAMVDPYSYRDRLTQPKLLLLGTNDPYWPLDALKVYWDQLPEPKRVLYLANETHRLSDINRLIGSLAALHRYSAQGKLLPQVSEAFTLQADRLELAVRTDQSPQRVLAWSAVSPTRDFRQAHLDSHPCQRISEGYLCQERMASDHYTALYAEAVFADPAAPAFSLSTTVCIAGGSGPELTAC